MNTLSCSTTLKVAALAVALTCGAGLRANTVPATSMLDTSSSIQPELQTVAFRDSAEAKMLRDAYHILATGDHDYDGHRLEAMHSVEAAAKLLDVDLTGDDKDKESQPLSDDKLREAKGLLTQVLGSAEVKDQSRIVKHLKEAVKHIDTALKVH